MLTFVVSIVLELLQNSYVINVFHENYYLAIAIAKYIYLKSSLHYSTFVRRHVDFINVRGTSQS